MRTTGKDDFLAVATLTFGRGEAAGEDFGGVLGALRFFPTEEALAWRCVVDFVAAARRDAAQIFAEGDFTPGTKATEPRRRPEEETPDACVVSCES